jgi:hypothetical protein
MLCIVLKRKLAQRYTYAMLCSALKRKLAQRYTYAMLCSALKRKLAQRYTYAMLRIALIKLRNRNCDIHCYKNCINAYQHVISKNY